MLDYTEAMCYLTNPEDDSICASQSQIEAYEMAIDLFKTMDVVIKSYENLIEYMDECNLELIERSKMIDEWSIETMRDVICKHYEKKLNLKKQ